MLYQACNGVERDDDDGFLARALPLPAVRSTLRKNGKKANELVYTNMYPRSLDPYAFLSLPLQLLDVLSLATSVHEPDLVERALLRPSPRLAPRRNIARGPLLPHGSDGRGGAS